MIRNLTAYLQVLLEHLLSIIKDNFVVVYYVKFNDGFLLKLLKYKYIMPSSHWLGLLFKFVSPLYLPYVLQYRT